MSAEWEEKATATIERLNKEREEIRVAFEEGWFHGSCHGYAEARSGHPKTGEEQLEEDWKSFQAGERI